MERRTYNPCDECPHGIDRRDGSGNDAMCRICEFNAYLKLGTIDHLRDLLQAEQDGLLVVLPCKAGSLIYVGRKPAIITRFFGYVRERYFHAVFCDENKGIDIPFEELGKTVFLTREEAEAALAQEGGTDEDSGGL